MSAALSNLSNLIESYVGPLKQPHRCAMLLALASVIRRGPDDFRIGGWIIRWALTPAKESPEPAWRITELLRRRYNLEVTPDQARAFRSAMQGHGGCDCTRASANAYLTGVAEAAQLQQRAVGAE